MSDQASNSSDLSRSEESQLAEVPALKVRQWLPEWDEVQWDPNRYQAEPPHHFYILSLPARELRRLSNVHRRKAVPGVSRTTDLNAQRYHDAGRSGEIAEFVRFGFPWSDLSDSKRNSGAFADLRKPGWLPTSIVVNILQPEDTRDGVSLDKEHAIVIEDNGATATFHLPNYPPSDQSLAPIEVIDGQHRLWAFEDDAGDYELPVVAFYGLDRSWQAYLFWVINIKPKRINASLAFDLYPLLRGEEWLDRFYGHSIYRETRSQELVQALWSHPQSPWHNRINMLGEPGQRRRMVSQAAWVRSLNASFVKAWTDTESSIGGLFGARVGRDEIILGWDIHQQSALLIHIWQSLENHIKHTELDWARSLRDLTNRILPSDIGSEVEESDPAFSGEFSLLNTDQGVRACLHVFNDLLFVQSDSLALQDWQVILEPSDQRSEIDQALVSLNRNDSIAPFVEAINVGLSSFDWRTSAFPGFDNDLVSRERKSAYRGSGGYKLLRSHLLQWLIDHHPELSAVARTVQHRLGYQTNA